MQVLSNILIVLSGSVFVFTTVLLYINAFRSSLGWAIASLLCPVLIIAFAIKYEPKLVLVFVGSGVLFSIGSLLHT